jgi:osmoprotectant transport system substrate-binding protein
MTRVIAGAVALLVALVLGGCGSDAKEAEPAKEPLRIGTKNFTESEIFGELYKQALESRGIPVTLQSQIGSTEVINQALRDGSLDMYPEYIGVLLSEVDGITDRPPTAQAAYELAKKLEKARRFTLLDATRASNENALAVQKAFGERKQIASIPDLKERLPRATLKAAPEFGGRIEGMVGLRKVYGLTKLRLRPWSEAGEQYPDLDSGKVDVALVFTTDSQLAGGQYTVLKDPKGVFATNHVAPLISQKALKLHGPQLGATLNAVSALLTTPVMRALNAKVSIDKRTPRDVAKEFLLANDITRAP